MGNLPTTGHVGWWKPWDEFINLPPKWFYHLEFRGTNLVPDKSYQSDHRNSGDIPWNLGLLYPFCGLFKWALLIYGIGTSNRFGFLLHGHVSTTPMIWPAQDPKGGLSYFKGSKSRFPYFPQVSISLNMFCIQKLVPKAFHEFDASTAIGFLMIWKSQVFLAQVQQTKFD